MKIVICPDSFKGSFSAKEVAKAIRKGMKSVLTDAQYSILPMADGGEGTTDALLNAIGGKKYKALVSDPLGRKICAEYAILSDGTGVIEMASASGLPLLKPEERNPLLTSTYGTGQLILELIKKKVKSFLIGVGGSATVDGGMGMAKALGVKFYSRSKKELREGGGFLGKLVKIDTSGINVDVLRTDITVLCDVTNPLTGRYGAAKVFAPQKGADIKMVELLEKNLRHYAQVIREQLKKDVENIPGSGAAGGLAAGLVAFLNAKIKEGSKFIAEKIELEKHIKDADIVITGEGRIDGQVSFGKTIMAVLEKAKRHNVPVIALCGIKSGSIDDLYRNGLTAVFSIVPGPVKLEESIKNAGDFIKDTSREIARLIKCFCRKRL
ncbi:MAG: glycerate kinase [Candidatus Omnitrophica bacterium]|nr:glycerate kinase [Candidatus Omnitrophota bacterium]MCM8828386.1 glycerate kinase [Candidatus Omnitrophota bacterium]